MRCYFMTGFSLCLSILIGSVLDNVTAEYPVLLEEISTVNFANREKREAMTMHLSSHLEHESVQNALSGYLVIRKFSDQNCRILSKVDSTLLNTCIPESSNTTAVMWTANSTSISKTDYADPKCSTAQSTLIRPLRKKCNSYFEELPSNETSYQPISSAISFRNYLTNADCQSSPYYISSFPPNQCMGRFSAKVTGSAIQMSNYRRSNCSAGVDRAYTYDSGVCSLNMDRIGVKGGKVSYTYGDPPALSLSPSPSPPVPPVPSSPSISSTVSPSTAPIASFSTSSSSSAKNCFAGSETVRMESGEIKFISQVVVGDSVQSSDVWGKIGYSEVVFVPHKTNNHKAMFSHLVTESGRDIRMTPDHLIVTGACQEVLVPSMLQLQYSCRVSVGDCVMTESGQEKVSKVTNVQGEGVYTIVTNKELLIVSGFIASPFGTNHLLADTYYNMHRMVYAAAPWILSHPILHHVNEELGGLVPLFLNQGLWAYIKGCV